MCSAHCIGIIRAIGTGIWSRPTSAPSDRSLNHQTASARDHMKAQVIIRRRTFFTLLWSGMARPSSTNLSTLSSVSGRQKQAELRGLDIIDHGERATLDAVRPPGFAPPPGAGGLY
jgi:hypothetical protein